jgi:Fibronectin type III domain
VQYRVRAISSRGNGAFSIRATFVLASRPTTTVPVKVYSTKNSVSVSWALVSDGGSPVLGYLLYQLNVTTGGEYLVYNGSSIPTITSFNSSGLLPGHFYQFRV